MDHTEPEGECMECLDAAIVAAVWAGARRFVRIRTRPEVIEEAACHPEPHMLVGRRLQSLRRRAVLRYGTGNGWEVAEDD